MAPHESNPPSRWRRIHSSPGVAGRRVSDVLGSWIYGLSRDNGFLYCVIDGEPNLVVEAEVITEIGETESAV